MTETTTVIGAGKPGRMPEFGPLVDEQAEFEKSCSVVREGIWRL